MTTPILSRSKEGDIGTESIKSILSTTSPGSYEDITLVWVDWDANETADARHTQTCLRAVINDVKIFTTAEQTIEYFQWIALEKKILLITSGSLAESVLCKIHSGSQLEAVYIFCMDKQKHASLMNQYCKIRGIFIDKFQLFHQMAEDVLQSEKNSFPMHIFAQKHENGIETSMRDYATDNNVTLNWGELFSFILLHLPIDRKQAKQDMVDQCRLYYHGDVAEQRKIDQFVQENSTENIIHWYSLDSFVYRLVNRALRTLNIDVIFKFRFFINELYRQLKRHHTNYLKSLLNTPTSTTKIHTVYRGQLISSDEVKKLKNNVEKIISANSFLSTTDDREMAEGFIIGAPFSKSVLFEIEIPDSYYDQISSSQVYTRPFFKTDLLSQFSDENEVIFAMGTTFRILSIEGDSVWNIHLELDEHNNTFTKYITDFRKKYRHPSNWQTRSSVDERILLLTEKLPKTYRPIVNLYIEEGIVIDEKQSRTPRTETITCYRKGFDLLCSCLPNHFYLLRVIMCLSIGIFYSDLGDTQMSIRLGEFALDIVKNYLFSDSECLLVCYNYLAVIYKLDNRPTTVYAIYRDMFHIARQHKNTSALLAICDKLCQLSRELNLHEESLLYKNRMLKYLARIYMRQLLCLPDHNHSLYRKYKSLIKFLQRLIKCKWSNTRKRSLKIFVTKKRPIFPSSVQYIDKLKFMFYFELDDLPKFQSSLRSLFAQVMTDFEARQKYEDRFEQLCQAMKRICTIVLTCWIKIKTNVTILKNCLQSLDGYERSLYTMRVRYGLTELMKRYENIVFQQTLTRLRCDILDLIDAGDHILTKKQQHRIIRPRHRSSPVYLKRNKN